MALPLRSAQQTVACKLLRQNNKIALYVQTISQNYWSDLALRTIG